MAIDLAQQRRALEERLNYYCEVFPDRSEEYRAFKLRHSIPRIHAALKRIDDGTYGSCVTCGSLIEERRLLLVPGALHCTLCQTEAEKGLG